MAGLEVLNPVEQFQQHDEPLGWLFLARDWEAAVMHGAIAVCRMHTDKYPCKMSQNKKGISVGARRQLNSRGTFFLLTLFLLNISSRPR